MINKSFIASTFWVAFALFFYSSCSLLEGNYGKSNSPHTRTHNSDKFRFRKDIAAFAKKQVGAKYRYGGKSPSGFDCSGFTTYVMNKFDVPVSGPSYAQENLGKKISEKEAQPGDLVFFRKSRMGKVFHVALVYENNRGDLTLIHSTSSRGVVMDRMSESSYWRSKVMTVRDVVGD